MKKTGKVLIICFLATSSLAVAGFVKDPEIYVLIKKNITIFKEVYREVSLHYVDKINPEKLIRKGINAMLESLDPYTVLIDEGQKHDMDIITRGSYGGIGVDVGFRGEKIVVISPMEGYPAFKGGIRAGDIITKVDGIAIGKMSPEEVQNVTLGKPGTKLTITIQRYGSDHPLTFHLKRQRIEVHNISYAGLVGRNKDVGYIGLDQFSRNAAREVRKALNQLRKNNKLTGLVLDLRNNAGGLLEEAVGIVDEFVVQNTKVVETRGRQHEQDEVFRTKKTPLAPDLPVVVLQNEGSASASEIVAGALQDLDRAVIIGTQSFGKGLVQVIRPLPYNTALKITTARYYIPSGRSIQSARYTHDKNNSVIETPDSLRKAFQTRNGRTVYNGSGISPDVKVPTEHSTILQTSLLQHNLFFDFANKYKATHDTLTETADSDKLFHSFKTFITKQNFHYQTPAERYLNEVDSALAGESAQPDIDALQEKIRKSKQKDFIEQKGRLMKALYLELVLRFEGQKGQIKASLAHDSALSEAIKVLHDQSAYLNILGDS